MEARQWLGKSQIERRVGCASTLYFIVASLFKLSRLLIDSHIVGSCGCRPVDPGTDTLVEATADQHAALIVHVETTNYRRVSIQCANYVLSPNFKAIDLVVVACDVKVLATLVPHMARCRESIRGYAIVVE